MEIFLKFISFRKENFWWTEVRKMGRYKHGKPNRELTLEEFREAITNSRISPLYKAYIVLLYWVGCRRSEPMAIRKEDIVEKDGALHIKIPAYKHGERGGVIALPLDYFGVNLIKEAWQRTRGNRRVFNFTDKTGYNYVKKVFPKMTPHWFRHNRITKLRRMIDGKTISLDDVKSFTGIKSDRTIQHYGMRTQEGVDRVVKVLT